MISGKLSAVDPKETFAQMQIKLNLFISMLVFGTAVSVAQERNCDMDDVDLLDCPVVEAPRVTELKGGFVELSFTVQQDGSVYELQVVDSAGDKRWIDAATATLSRWKFRASDEPVAKVQRFTFKTPNSSCSQSFSPIDVVEFIRGSPDSRVALAARPKGDGTTVHGIYNVDDASHLTGPGVRNADVLVSICGVPIADVFTGDRDSYWEASFCCTSESDEPALIFERESNGQIIEVPFL